MYCRRFRCPITEAQCVHRQTRRSGRGYRFVGCSPQAKCEQGAAVLRAWNAARRAVPRFKRRDEAKQNRAEGAQRPRHCTQEGGAASD